MAFPKMKGNNLLMAILFTCAMALSAAAQGYHFIYIQADGQQPFYLKYNGKNYSSTAIGYLILPKLSDGSFSVQIGFPRNQYPEQTFNLSVSGKDYGYALKSFADKGWGLFNFQTTDIVMNVNAAASETAQTPTVTTNTSNPFGNMLADAINDSTLNQQRTETQIVTAKKTIDSTFIALRDSLKDASDNKSNKSSITQPYNTQASVDSLVKVNTNSDSTAPAKATTDTARSIVKSAESTTSNGTDITFLDNAGKDTIHAFIPSANPVAENKNNPVKSKDDISSVNSDSSMASTQQPNAADTASASSMTANTITNSNCQKMISSYDIDKLRKKIAKTDSQGDILEAIKKALRDKCMTTEQVRDSATCFHPTKTATISMMRCIRSCPITSIFRSCKHPDRHLLQEPF